MRSAILALLFVGCENYAVEHSKEPCKDEILLVKNTSNSWLQCSHPRQQLSQVTLDIWACACDPFKNPATGVQWNFGYNGAPDASVEALGPDLSKVEGK